MIPQQRYEQVVRTLRIGARIPWSTIDQVLKAAGKTAEDLVHDVFAGATPAGPQPGDSCPCGGSLVIRTSRRQGSCQVQHLRCGTCGRRADHRRVVPAFLIRRQRKGV